MKRRHEGCDVLKWQAAWFRPTHETNVRLVEKKSSGGMKVTLSSSGKWHGLIVPMKKRSKGWNKMQRRHEGYNLLERQVAWFGPANQEKVSRVQQNEALA